MTDDQRVTSAKTMVWLVSRQCRHPWYMGQRGSTKTSK